MAKKIFFFTFGEEILRLRLMPLRGSKGALWKGTEEAYPRHVKNYVKFWEDDQDRRANADPNYVKIPAHPIVGENVAVFLKHELTRNKVCRIQLSLINYHRSQGLCSATVEEKNSPEHP